MSIKRYTARDVRNAVRWLNTDAGRPLERFREHLSPAGARLVHNVGHFDCDKSGSAFFKLYEISNEGGGERTICYAQTAQLACGMIDVFRQGVLLGMKKSRMEDAA